MKAFYRFCFSQDLFFTFHRWLEYLSCIVSSYNRIFSTLIHRFVVQVKMKELSAMEMKEEVFSNSIISQNYKK